MGDSSHEPITCVVGRWYYKRMLLMALMLGVFSAWFLYDGAVGWPKKNVAAVSQEIFNASSQGAPWERIEKGAEHYREMKEGASEETLQRFRDAYDAGRSKMPWNDYARKYKIPPEPGSGTHEAEVASAFQEGGKPGAAWVDYALRKSIDPDSKDDEDVAVKRAYEAAGKTREWAGYAYEHGWDSKKNKFHGKGDIREQFVIGGICGLCAMFALVLLLLNRNRTLSADGDSFTTPRGIRVPFGSVYRIDKRKWDNKGLAYAYYREGGGEGGKVGKAVVDDLKFVGAAAVLERLQENFDGEIVERASDSGEDESEEDSRASQTASDVSEASEKVE